jgi:hypothetical protein
VTDAAPFTKVGLPIGQNFPKLDDDLDQMYIFSVNNRRAYIEKSSDTRLPVPHCFHTRFLSLKLGARAFSYIPER